jgi:hypothetical protein
MPDLPVNQIMYVAYPDGVHTVVILGHGIPAGHVFPMKQKPKDPYTVYDQKTGQTYVVGMEDLWASPKSAAIEVSELRGEEEPLMENPVDPEDDPDDEEEICDECGEDLEDCECDVEDDEDDLAEEDE